VLTDERGAKVAAALADPEAAICARVYHRDPGTAFDPAAAIAKAWKRRGRFHSDRQTDCYRVVHGEADGLPGLRVERYADVLVVVVFATCIVPYLDAITAALAECLPGSRIVVRSHLDDLRREDVATRLVGGALPAPDTVVIGKEFGVELPLQPFAGLATGIYVDQRGTRRWLRKQCAGWRVCNLFAYTGLFSLSLLAAGAASAVDVDLAAPALEQATLAAQRNGLSDRHRVVHSDCSAFLREDRSQFDCLICDPPTAAQGGEGWISRRDYPALLGQALPRLAPGGLIVACSNTLGHKPADPEACLAAAEIASGVKLERLTAPDLDPDLPQISEFSEGRPFKLVVAQRRSN
jgi:23S rRNA (cytosine1962-C5)-methyltransferase